MASVKTWSTKEEVLKDLARASGRRIKKKEDLDEGYIVIGDGPPPVIVEDQDAEMQLLFGDAACRKEVATTEDATPDLLGIQQMLRMVHDYHDGDDDDIKINDASKSSDCVVITKVSHLNPNVKEFIPKSSSPSLSTVNSKNTSDSNSVNIVTQTGEGEDSSKINIDVNCNNIGVEVGLNDVESKEYQDIATKLKNKISDAAKSDSFELKKQKNVAIATLLRLYASNNKSPTKCSTEPLKLITPEYFEGKKDENLDDNIEKVTAAQQTVSSESVSSTPEPKNISSTIPSCSSNSISSPLQTLSDNNLQESITKTSPKVKLDPEIKRSIEKVNKWLEEPAKRKSPAVCLAPVAFKKKEPKDSHSSKSTSDTEQKTSKTSGKGQRYQPSAYAADLGRKYMERNKLKEEQSKDVTWSNLDQILKEKDLIIKKKLEDQASSSESNNEVVDFQA